MKQERPDHNDPITDAIFGHLEDHPKRDDSIFVRKGEEDALTRAIFSRLDSFSVDEKTDNQRDRKFEATLVGKPLTQEVNSDSLTKDDSQEIELSISKNPALDQDNYTIEENYHLSSSKDSQDARKAILAAIENIDAAELAFLEHRLFTKPLVKRTKLQDGLIAPVFTGQEMFQLEQDGSELTSLEKENKTKIQTSSMPEETLVRAQEDWFRVSYADIPRSTPRALSKIKSVSNVKVPPRREVIVRPHKKRKWKTFLAVTLLIFGAVGIAWTMHDEILEIPNSLKISLGRGGLTSNSSFVLLNAEADHKFKDFASLYTEIEQLQDKVLIKLSSAGNKESKALKEGLGYLNEAGKLLDEFFKQNEHFSHFAIFRPEGDKANAQIKNLETLQEIAQYKDKASLALGISFENKNEFARKKEELTFWQKVISASGTYLVIGMGPNQSYGLGEPEEWVALQIIGERAHTLQTGRVSELDAALVSKYIPPEAVQTFKTNFDVAETGWFLDSQVQGSLVADMFSATTGINLDGVVMISASFAEELSSNRELNFNTAKEGWVEDFVYELGRLNSSSEKVILRMISQALTSHRLSFYFRNSLNNESTNLVNSLTRELTRTPREDALGWGLRTWGQVAPDVELVEYSPSFLPDGSVVGDVSLTLRNNQNEESFSYLKIYLPENSAILKVQGWGEKKDIPKFDYKANNFKEIHFLEKITSPESLGDIQVFKEGNFTVIGGWVKLPPKTRDVVSLSNRLPYRLAWRGGSDEYMFRVLSSESNFNDPFRFYVVNKEEADFSWTDPKGFKDGERAEYQTNIFEDLILKGAVEFKE